MEELLHDLEKLTEILQNKTTKQSNTIATQSEKISLLFANTTLPAIYPNITLPKIYTPNPESNNKQVQTLQQNKHPYNIPVVVC